MNFSDIQNHSTECITAITECSLPFIPSFDYEYLFDQEFFRLGKPTSIEYDINNQRFTLLFETHVPIKTIQDVEKLAISIANTAPANTKLSCNSNHINTIN